MLLFTEDKHSLSCKLLKLFPLKLVELTWAITVFIITDTKLAESNFANIFIFWNLIRGGVLVKYKTMTMLH